MQQPHLLTYNLTAERQLPGSMALTVAYAGSRGINLQQDKEGNPEIPNGIPSNGLCVKPPAGTCRSIWQAKSMDRPPPATLPAPHEGTRTGQVCSVNLAGGDSFYNALEVMLNKRLSKGLQLQSSYTWSKLIDDATSAFVGRRQRPDSVSG